MRRPEPVLPPRPTTPPPPPPPPETGSIVVRVECVHGHAPAQVRGTLSADEVERLADLLSHRNRERVGEILRNVTLTVDTL